MFLYFIMSCEEWDRMKRGPTYQYTDGFWGPEVREFMREQVAKRLGDPAPLVNDPVYCWCKKPPTWCGPFKRAVCKVAVPEDSVVYFDDLNYVQVLNCLNNPTMLFVSRTEEEWERMKNCTREESIASCERMFDLTPRSGVERTWSGDVKKQAFIRELTLDMIKKVWIYRKRKRLRRKNKGPRRSKSA
jgi:hypothetical protein